MIGGTYQCIAQLNKQCYEGVRRETEPINIIHELFARNLQLEVLITTKSEVNLSLFNLPGRIN